MALISKEQLAEIKSKVSIVDLISQYVQLSKNGKSYLGLCPFHGEKTPSFNVNAEKGFFHCFGCGKSGDALAFLQEYKQLTFGDAARELAEEAGIVLDLADTKTVKENPNQVYYEVNNQAAKFYHMLLLSTELGAQAREYLYQRGIDDEIIERFNVGIAPDEENFLYLNLSQKFDEKVLANSGLFNFSQDKIYDGFTRRIMFPLKNEYGHVVGFSGRKWQEPELSDKTVAKYKNTSTTAVFDKSFELYNLDKAKSLIKKTKEVYLMEGFMDVIAAYKAGVLNVVASMGTALTEKHVGRLRKLAKHFVLAYDGDDAGQNAINKSLNLLAKSSVEIVRIPDRLDPDDYAKEYSPEALKQLLEDGRIQPVEFLIDFLRPDNLVNLQVQLDFLERMALIIAAVPSITAQDLYIRKLVEILPDFEYNQVETAVNLRRENQQGRQEFDTQNQYDDSINYFNEADIPPPAENFPDQEYAQGNFGENDVKYAPSQILTQKPLSKIELTEEHLLQRMIYHPELIQRFSEDESFKLTHQRYQDLFEKMIYEYYAFAELEQSHFTENLTDEQRNLFFQVLNHDLPEEYNSAEIEGLLLGLSKDKVKMSYDETLKALAIAQQAGNKDRVVELTLELISIKRNL